MSSRFRCSLMNQITSQLGCSILEITAIQYKHHKSKGMLNLRNNACNRFLIQLTTNLVARNKVQSTYPGKVEFENNLYRYNDACTLFFNTDTIFKDACTRFFNTDNNLFRCRPIFIDLSLESPMISSNH